MIVKVQLSRHSSASARRVLVYNQDKSVKFDGDADPELIAKMGDREKMFCEGNVVDGVLDLFPNFPYPDQGW